MFRCSRLLDGCATLARLRKLSSASGMDLGVVVGALNRIAPIKLAEKWDNVGLLIEPSAPHIVKRIFLTNDLTEDVLDEAVKENANMIVSYHPPLFRSFKKLTSNSWKERIAIRAIENRIAIYSPHTSSDAVESGVNDWLASGLGKHSHLQPITHSKDGPSGGLLACSLDNKEQLDLLTVGAENSVKATTLGETSRLFLCKNGAHHDLVKGIQSKGMRNSDILMFPAAEMPIPHTGAGRLCILEEATQLSMLVQRVKDHLKLRHIRLALGRAKSLDGMVKSIALCAGSGASVLSCCKADVYLTGEMSHHEVLDATQDGISVILCEHSNTERGYLNVLKEKLCELLECEKDSIIVSKIDNDPLEIV